MKRNIIAIIFALLVIVGAAGYAQLDDAALGKPDSVTISTSGNTVKAGSVPFVTTSQLNRLVTSTASTVVALTGRTLIEIMPCSTTTDIVVSVGVATATVTGSSGRPVTMAAPFREYLDDDIVVWVIATASQYICITQTSY
jgi:hypothetical protein